MEKDNKKMERFVHDQYKKEVIFALSYFHFRRRVIIKIHVVLQTELRSLISPIKVRKLFLIIFNIVIGFYL